MKTKMKRILSLFLVAVLIVPLLVSLTSEKAKAADEVMPASYTVLTYGDLGFFDGPYNLSDIKDTPAIDANLENGVVIAGYLKFESDSASRLCFGENIDVNGIKLYGGTNELVLQNMLGDPFITTFKPEVAGVPVTGEFVDLKLSFQKVDHDGDGTKDDLKLGVWFADKLYNNEYIYRNNYPFINSFAPRVAFHKQAPYSNTQPNEAIVLSSTPPVVEEKIPESYTEFTFDDLGFGDGSYETSMTKDTPAIDANMENGVVISGQVKFGNDSSSRICFGAGIDNNGIKVYGGGNELVIQNMLGDSFITTFKSEVVGYPVTDEYVDLKLSFQKVDHDGDGTKDDLKLGVWFADKLYNNQYYYRDNYPFIDSFAPTISVHRQPGAEPISIKSAVVEEYTEFTFADLGFAAGNIETSVTQSTPVLNTYVEEGVAISGQVKFENNSSSRICFGEGIDNNGLKLYGGTNELVLQNMLGDSFITTFKSDVVGYPVTGEYVDLKLTFRKIDHDGDGAKDDLKLGVWFAGELYNDEYIYLDNYSFIDPFVPTVSIHRQPGAEPISLKVDTADETIPEDFAEFTFADLGFGNGEYSAFASMSTPVINDHIANGVVISGRVKFESGSGSRICFGAGADNNGFKLHPDRGNDLVIQNMLGGFFYYKFTEEIAGVPVIDAFVDLKLSFQKIDHDGDGAKDDLKLGAWFADKLYNNQYIYFDNYPFIDPFIPTISILPQDGVSVEINCDIVEEVMPEGMTEYTFDDLGFADGNYEESTTKETPNINVNIENGVVVAGKLKFESFSMSRICFGEGVDNNGFKLHTANSENLVIQNMLGNFFYYEFTEEVAGVPVTDQYVDLKLSFQKIDHDGDGAKDDLKLGAWFAGKLYNNQYIYIDNYPFIDPFVPTITVHPHDTVAIGVSSKAEMPNEPKPNKPNNNNVAPDVWKELTWTDFNLSDGVYKGDPSSGKYESGLNKKEIRGFIKLSGNVQVIFSLRDGWTGLYMYMNDSGELILQVIDGKYSFVAGFNEQDAGVPIKDALIDLKLSFELVDKDNDGDEDDLKLGVFFANKLYKNEYFYLRNYPHMEKGVANSIIIVPKEGSLELKSIERGPEIIDFDKFGLSLSTWNKVIFADVSSPKTGGKTTNTPWLLWGGIALFASACLGYVFQKKRKGE